MATFILWIYFELHQRKNDEKEERKKKSIPTVTFQEFALACATTSQYVIFFFNFVKTINKKKFLYAEDSSSMIHWNVHEGSVRHMQNISRSHTK